ncbi:4'-phosphopantetheinyl transferase superfamily protein [Hirsutella rhossiliensis]|uniref:holo-[acyl-carrier-protein] synthase n=1 Tax=Hirsutella rhossiliensis TaxID=111463 RepID=A0A9P8MZC1_9HYPO|nr:4'-phosphopantetheinyl transferase superfamily domain-containing protein [Hirsutella rhossiliensis]KAH0964035.1 4'-phosphopantetheinyl transferase superfamily domain-containing protein [Hirsutella rhossiliensis]
MSGQAAPATGRMTVLKWVLDTRPLWPEAKQTKDLTTTTAARALALLNAQERDQVLRFYFVKDAKLALGSALLKRLAISRHAGVAWDDAGGWTRDARTKPVFRRPRDGAEPLLFNVSHQAGLVVLVGIHHRPADHEGHVAIGVDVVCPAERRERDLSTIAAEGWARYVAVHDDVFCPAEAARLVALPRLLAAAADDDRLLAYFYTLWCLREAYIKMTGDALLAPWLRELDLRYFAPPGQSPPEDRALEIWFRGQRVDDVHMRLEALLDGYVICTAVRCGQDHRTDVEAQVAQPAAHLNLDEILAEAEAARAPRVGEGGAGPPGRR